MSERRWWRPRPDLHGAWLERLARYGAWVMVRRVNGARPFVIAEAEWAALPTRQTEAAE